MLQILYRAPLKDIKIDDMSIFFCKCERKKPCTVQNYRQKETNVYMIDPQKAIISGIRCLHTVFCYLGIADFNFKVAESKSHELKHCCTRASKSWLQTL